MKNLLGMLRDWKKSYACIPDKLKVHHKSLARNLASKSALSNSPEHQDEEITFEISDDSMSFFQAQAHCNLQGKRLADPSTDVDLQMMINKMSLLPIGTSCWFQDKRAASTDTFCENQCCHITLAAAGAMAYFGPSPECVVGNRAICMSGQATTTTSITTTLKEDLPIVPMFPTINFWKNNRKNDGYHYEFTPLGNSDKPAYIGKDLYSGVPLEVLASKTFDGKYGTASGHQIRNLVYTRYCDHLRWPVSPFSC
ncbi:Oidioi.mRNA.OKI2018_I69.chr1.g1530.t1.cds [Oikopleura dioica]|uniref:Oidioi.mRNA.OKI2018_I69.chr1.g1530.t1.cds n=1 Tax=Oikopleura dioica TaxID=34765 RepID=A0ABN7SSG2_OIKDI|nr:Oidioi.mRNA.OKI2018_I69.chr1.g1530.t1.cds [Oikopleura dioica]